MNPIQKKFNYGDHEVVLEAGRIARQATASVLVTMSQTAVLVSVVGRKEANPGQSFFPLTVNYEERAYSAGKIPGGFFKREGRPSEKETLTSRLIDRPIRPLFPKGFMNEVQVTCQVVSAEKDIDPDIPAMIGTSAALALSGIPFAGPIGAARVGFTREGYQLNPTMSQLEDSYLDMVVAGTESAVLMVESEAKELTEDQMLGAVLYAHQEMQVVIRAINEFCEVVGVESWDWTPEPVNQSLMDAMVEAAGQKLSEAYQISEKMKRQDAVAALKEEALAQFVSEEGPSRDEVSEIFGKIEKKTVRRAIIDGQPRIDGRDTKTVRDIRVEVGAGANAWVCLIYPRRNSSAGHNHTRFNERCCNY